jgi:hypothetical protein
MNLVHAVLFLAGSYHRLTVGFTQRKNRMFQVIAKDGQASGHAGRFTAFRATGRTGKVQDRWGSLLHDIGKMGLPDGILLKPGPPTDEEGVIMKKHPTFAYEMPPANTRRYLLWPKTETGFTGEPCNGKLLNTVRRGRLETQVMLCAGRLPYLF